MPKRFVLSRHQSPLTQQLILAFLILLQPAACLFAADEPAPTAEALAFFEKEVRPLLIQTCQKCHGPKKQEASLRLDARAHVLKGGDSGPAIVLSEPEKSRLIEAIRYQGDVKMPPSGKLRDEQIAVLVKWIKLGAPWASETLTAATRGGEITAAERGFWSFQPVRNPPPPAVKDVNWPATPIDHFILAKLEEKNLPPNGPTDKRTLLRRATFDLIGLPPTPEEIQDFLGDNSPEAFSRVVDRLLSSRHYGERWGRHWLDVVRYADTAGDGADYPVREAYKYRNYVIESFNADKPYDEFVREQIAGDIIGNQEAAAGNISVEKYADRITATGYIAVTKRFGYNVNTAFQHLDIADTLDGLGRSILGLSVGCARCHDHKYDPISAADYYGLYGIFSSSKYSFPGGEEFKRPHHLVPLEPPAIVAAKEKGRQDEIAKVDAELQRIGKERATALEAVRFGGGLDYAFELQALNKPPANPWFTQGPNAITAEAQSPFIHVHPMGTRGVRIQTGQPGDGVRQNLTAARTVANSPKLYFNLDFRNVNAVEGDGAYRFHIGQGAITSSSVECSISSKAFAIRNGAQPETIRPLEMGVWYNLQLSLDLEKKTFSGRIGRPGDVTEFADKAFVPTWNGNIDTFICDGTGHVAGVKPTHDLDNLVLQPEPFATVTAIAEPAKPAEDKYADLRTRLEQFDATTVSLNQQKTEVANRELYPFAYGISEGTPANVKIQKRGEPDKLGADVPRHFLEILGGDALPPTATGSGRLELAHWLTRPTNPLTPRVMVNRIWQQHFGQGIVETPSDFGTRGMLPSHPELLDYLASRFMTQGWSIKKLHRDIMLSKVYQLASDDQPQHLLADPANRFLWKHSRRRLEAETMRDGMLALSGVLDRTQPQGHPFPNVNTWSFTIHYPFYGLYDSNHRSVYLMTQRSRRHPYLALFDGADPNISTDARQLTTTPTQALYLMNDPFVHAQSQAFARRVLASQTDDRGRIQWAFVSVYGRDATEDEITQAIEFLGHYRQKLTELKTPPEQLPETAWSALSRVMLTSNGFMYVE